ncbi:MAG TPA: aquaporin, partial [Opitutaceae bacterium]|nr:aquaporin [Opitutaceae bacterium]
RHFQSSTHRFMKKYLVEFIGTFFLVFTVGTAVRSGAWLAPLAIGSSLMVMVFAGGHISGGHFNPAVTLAVWLRGKLEMKEVIPYWLAQFAAGAIAALIVTFLFRGLPAGGPALRGTVPSLIVEFIFTFALAWVVLNVATAKGTTGNSFYGLAIGFTVMIGAVAVGGISGGSFNPAVGLGVFTMGLENLHQLGVYLAAELAGAAVAALTFKAINGVE